MLIYNNSNEATNQSEITFETLGKIVEFFNEEVSEFDINNVEIKIGLTPFKLRKIDEYLFLKQNPKATKNEFVHTPEVHINFGGINFQFHQTETEEKIIYKIDEDGEQYAEMV